MDNLYDGSSWSAEEELGFNHHMDAAEAAFERQFNAAHGTED